MPGNRKEFAHEVTEATMSILSDVPGRLQESLYEVEMLEERLVSLLAQVREKKVILERAVNDYGTP